MKSYQSIFWTTLFFLIFFFSIHAAYAEEIHLKNGENIHGRITQITDEEVVIESENNHGVLNIPRSEIKLIVFPESQIDLNQKYGIGYLQHKSTVNGSRQSYNYTSDQLSLKIFLEEDMFVQGVVAYGQVSKEGSTVLDVFDVGGRMGLIHEKTMNRVLYYGGSVEFINIKDTENDIDDDGIAIRGFVGAEFFFATLPSIGFSAELAVGLKLFGKVQTRDISSSTFPAFSMHYYF